MAPIVITPTTLPEIAANQFHAMGVDLIIYSNVVMRTIVRSVSEALDRLLNAQYLDSVQDRLASLEDHPTSLVPIAGLKERGYSSRKRICPSLLALLDSSDKLSNGG